MIAPSCSDPLREITESANCCSADRMPLTTYESAELASEIVGSAAMGDWLDASEMACCSCACACTTFGLDSTLSKQLPLGGRGRRVELVQVALLLGLRVGDRQLLGRPELSQADQVGPQGRGEKRLLLRRFLFHA